MTRSRWLAMTMTVVLALLVLAVPGRGAAQSAASDWGRTESGRVRLIAATVATGDASPLRLGVQFALAPGWKIYWRSPGDAGYPPRIDWSGSVNLGGADLRWPAPHRFVLAGLQSHGYDGEVTLPVTAAIAEPGRPLAIRAKVEFLACATLCVPQQATLSLDLPAGPAAPSVFAHDLARAEARIPGDGAGHGLFLQGVEAVGEGKDARLRVTVTATLPFDTPDIFLESDVVAAFAPPTVTVSSDRRQARFEVAPAESPTASLAGAAVTVTVVDGDRALEAQTVPVAALSSGAAGEGLAAMLLVALLGGLILNLMPCVLPVLSIKLLGILGHGGAERRHVRYSFIASAAGIVVSFLALAGLAIALRAAGQAVGWGIQFQQPGFLAVMIVILTVFAANLWGVFEIALPSWLVERLPDGTSRHAVWGHFLSGGLATVLATPCSAPFLGTAIGFALTRGPVEIVLIFTALGVGMAAPFLVVAALPDLVRSLPRPGRWMIRLRRLMAVALALTALWLGTVLSAQMVDRLAPAAPSAAGTVSWVPFEPEAIPALVAAGRTVFVDVTADWCITCKLNKLSVIDREDTARLLSAPGVVAMRADWTRPDERVSGYLAGFGRYGIPFNAVHGPAAPEGLALPELLTAAAVAAALDRATVGTARAAGQTSP